MMDPEFIKWLATLGVGGVLAGFMFAFYRKDVKTYTLMWQGQSEQLITVVKENTKAITENTLIIKSLHRRNDHIEDALTTLSDNFTRARETPAQDKRT